MATHKQKHPQSEFELLRIFCMSFIRFRLHFANVAAIFVVVPRVLRWLLDKPRRSPFYLIFLTRTELQLYNDIKSQPQNFVSCTKIIQSKVGFKGHSKMATGFGRRRNSDLNKFWKKWQNINIQGQQLPNIRMIWCIQNVANYYIYTRATVY